MFEAVELGHKVEKEEYAAAEPELRRALLQAQLRLRDTKTPVIVVLSGVEGSGRGDVTNRLSQWMDMRDVQVHSFDRLSEEEETHPEFWRFWRALPARGKISVFINSWYTDPLMDRALDEGKRGQYERRLSRIAQFERMLADDGAVILKFWLHLSKKEQGRRLKRLEEHKSTRWRVTPERWARHEAYDNVLSAAETLIRTTDAAYAPWMLVESKDRRWRDLTVGRTLCAAIETELARQDAPKAEEAPAPQASLPALAGSAVTVLDRVDLSQKLEEEEYDRRLSAGRERLAKLSRKAYNEQISTVMVFEGWDAAGKGGAIRRVCRAIDARYTRTLSIAKPTPEEYAQHYLWRFWRDVPRPGHVSIYDRSWYGRVLVERVEGFASHAEWARAYGEINQFEEQLTEHGIILLKFWIHISPEEQLARFKEREQIPYKRHKITDEDWRNREKWPQYQEAVNEMVARTSTAHAPWTLVAGNDKRFARVQVLETVRKKLELCLKDR